MLLILQFVHTQIIAAIQDPTFIYWQPPFQLIVRNTDGSEQLMSKATKVFSITYDPWRKEIFWTGWPTRSITKSSSGSSNNETVNSQAIVIYSRKLGINGLEGDKDEIWNLVFLPGASSDPKFHLLFLSLNFINKRTRFSLFSSLERYSLANHLDGIRLDR